MRITSTNVGAAIPAPAGTMEHTGIDKQPVPSVELTVPAAGYGGGSGVVGDVVADYRFHGGADKAVYAYAREELDYWEGQLGRSLRNGVFGENLTTEGIVWAQVRIGQRLAVGTALLEVSVPRQPCGTFAAWLGEKGWIKTFTQRGDCGAYLRVVEPGTISAGDEVRFLDAPAHDITMGLAFAAKMGDNTAARRVVDAAVLPAVHHDKLVARLAAADR